MFVTIGDNLNAEICHDINGNIFIVCNDKYYWLYIDKHDNLMLDIIDDINLLTTVENYNIQFRKIKHTFDLSSLKGKIMNELDEETNNEHDDDMSDFEDEDEEHVQYRNAMRHYPEDRHYYCDYAENCEDYEEDDICEEFNFSRFGDDDFVRQLNVTFESNSLYDTIILNKTININAVVFTMESNAKSSYRITIGTDGMFTLNIVGTSVRHYTLNSDMKFLRIVH
jgi:hypothetical protein